MHNFFVTEAAHIKPVEHGGPDSIQNGIALSGTAHWMFDRGLIGFDDDLGILVSRQVNDRSSIDAMINKTGRALADSFVYALKRRAPGIRPAWLRPTGRRAFALAVRWSRTEAPVAKAASGVPRLASGALLQALNPPRPGEDFTNDHPSTSGSAALTADRAGRACSVAAGLGRAAGANRRPRRPPGPPTTTGAAPAIRLRLRR